MQCATWGVRTGETNCSGLRRDEQVSGARIRELVELQAATGLDPTTEQLLEEQQQQPQVPTKRASANNSPVAYRQSWAVATKNLISAGGHCGRSQLQGWCRQQRRGDLPAASGEALVSSRGHVLGIQLVPRRQISRPSSLFCCHLSGSTAKVFVYVSQFEASDDALRQAAEFIVGRLEARELTRRQAAR